MSFNPPAYNPFLSQSQNAENNMVYDGAWSLSAIVIAIVFGIAWLYGKYNPNGMTEGYMIATFIIVAVCILCSLYWLYREVFAPKPVVVVTQPQMESLTETQKRLRNIRAQINR